MEAESDMSSNRIWRSSISFTAAARFSGVHGSGVDVGTSVSVGVGVNVLVGVKVGVAVQDDAIVVSATDVCVASSAWDGPQADNAKPNVRVR